VRAYRILELCACEGGATVGLQRAGFEVYAVDLDRHRLKRNPAQGRRVDDALDVLARLLDGERVGFKTRGGQVIMLALEDFDAVWVSPPCQYYTRGNAPLRGDGEVLPTHINGWPRLIPTFRGLLRAARLPYVIENVRDAAWDMHAPTLLCGCMFDLSVLDRTCTAADPLEHLGTCDAANGVEVHLERGRLFETNFSMLPPRRCEGEGQPRNNHPSHEWVAGAYGGARRDKYEARYVRKGGYVPPEKWLVAALLGIEHEMTWNGLFECIPPVYAEHVGRAMLLTVKAAA